MGQIGLRPRAPEDSPLCATIRRDESSDITEIANEEHPPASWIPQERQGAACTLARGPASLISFSRSESIFMQTRCPDCGSTGVLRSHPGDLDGPATTLLRSRYYCRNCRKAFWALSPRIYRIGAIALGLALTLLGVVSVLITD